MHRPHSSSAHLYIFAESRRVVVSRRLCVSECLHDGVRCQDLLFRLTHPAATLIGAALLLLFTTAWPVRILDCSKVSHNVLGRDRLASSRLSRDDDGLVLFVSDHTSIGVFGNGKEMGLELTSTLARICLDDLRAVQIELEEGIDGDEHDTRVGVNESLRISIENGMEH